MKVVAGNPSQNILEQINRYMSGTPPHSYKQWCWCVQRDFNIVRGLRERLFIQVLLSVMVQNFFEIFWPGL